MKQSFFHNKLLIPGVIFLLLLSCDTEEEENEEPELYGDQVLMAKDVEAFILSQQTLFQEIDNVISTGNNSGLCGAEAEVTPGHYDLSFDGTTSCNTGRFLRSGNIRAESLSGPDNRGKQGNKLKVTATDFEVIRIDEWQSMRINGTQTITNLSGGTISDLTADSPPVVHEIKGEFEISFNRNQSTHTWTVDFKRETVMENSTYITSITGDTALNGLSDIILRGQNIFGNAFTVSTESPMVYNSFCERGAVAGILNYSSPSPFRFVAGVNNAGAETGDQSCPYGFKASWTNREGEEVMHVIAY